MHTRVARGSLSKHLQNSITYILRVENHIVQQPPPNDDTPRRCKMCVIAPHGCELLHLIGSHGKGNKSAKDSMGKVKSQCAK